MQLAIKKQWWFTSYLKETSLSWKRTKPSQPAFDRYNLFRTCSELPLDRFMRCLCNEEFSQLVRTGSAPEHILLQAWNQIYTEYIDLDGSTQTLYLNQLRRDLMLMGCKIDRVITIVNILDMAPHAMLIAELKELRFPFKYDFKDFSRYRKDLAGTIHRLAPWRLEYSKLEKELDALLTSNQGEAKIERSYFDGVLSRLSKYNQYQVRANNLTVTEFVTMLKQYLQYVEANKRGHGEQR